MKKTITLVRLRSSERYKEPLTTIVDSMFHVYEKFTLYNFDYNFNFIKKENEFILMLGRLGL